MPFQRHRLGRRRWNDTAATGSGGSKDERVDAGRFVDRYGDEAHKQGYCLYKVGCKGPQTHANCSVLHFGESADAWPIGLGHPCFGCTEQTLAFRVPMHETVDIERPTPPDTYPPIAAPQGHASAIAAGLAGLAGGALLGAGYKFAKSMDTEAPPKADGGKKEG